MSNPQPRPFQPRGEEVLPPREVQALQKARPANLHRKKQQYRHTVRQSNCRSVLRRKGGLLLLFEH